MTRLEALRASAKAWHEKATAEDLHTVLITSSACPLCTLYIKDACRDCPVAQTIGDPYCENIYYHDATAAYHRWKIHGAAGFRSAALAFAEFLDELAEAEQEALQDART